MYNILSAGAPSDPATVGALEDMVKHRQLDLYLPFLVGAWLDSLCLGLIFVLFFRWVTYVRPTDSKWTQALVWWLIIPTCVTSSFLLAHNFFLFVGGFGEYLRIFNVDLPRATTVNFVLSRVPAASFFAVRAWRLNDRPIWLPFIVIPCLLFALFITGGEGLGDSTEVEIEEVADQSVTGASVLTHRLGCLVGGIMHTALAKSIPLSKLSLDMIILYSVCEVVSDLVITGSLFYGLLKRKSGWAHTDKLIKRIVKLILETQTPPALTALLFLAMSVIVGDGTILGYFIFYTKIHVLCLLAVVNARIGMSDSAGGASTFSGQVKSNSGATRSGVRVHTETITRNSWMPPPTQIVPNDAEETVAPGSTTDLVRRQSGPPV